MSERGFNIGDRSMCFKTGVVGKCIKFYTPTACEEQTMVLTDTGKKYHAPTRTWERVLSVEDENGVIVIRNHLLENIGVTQKCISAFDEQAVTKNRSLFLRRV